MPSLTIDTPTGPFTLVETDGAITGAGWRDPGRDHTGLLDLAAGQLRDYFDGSRQVFDLPMEPPGSAMQRRFCAAMAAIPFGETRTYGELAAELGISTQAAGQLAGGNPIPILIPCHRVMGAGGKLVGFSGGQGVETKVWLLRHEGAAGLLI